MLGAQTQMSPVSRGIFLLAVQRPTVSAEPCEILLFSQVRDAPGVHRAPSSQGPLLERGGRWQQGDEVSLAISDMDISVLVDGKPIWGRESTAELNHGRRCGDRSTDCQNLLDGLTIRRAFVVVVGEKDIPVVSTAMASGFQMSR